MSIKNVVQGSITAGVLAVILSASFFRVGEDPAVEVVGNEVSDFFFPRACAGAMDSKQQLLDTGGNYFCVQNGTVNSGVNYALSATYAATTAAMTFHNATSSTKMLLPDHIYLGLSGTAPASTTSIQYLFAVDTGTRSATANNQTRTPTNASGSAYDPSTGVLRTGAPYTSSAAVQVHNAGAMTIATATANNRIIAEGAIELGLAIVGDEYFINFGGSDPGSTGMMAAARSTTPGRFATNAPPTVIAPGQTGVLHLWLPNAITTAPAFRYRACWYEL